MYRKERKSMTQSKSATYRQILLKLAAIITAGILLSSCSHIPVYAKTDPGWNGQGGVAQEQTEGGEYTDPSGAVSDGSTEGNNANNDITENNSSDGDSHSEDDNSNDSKTEPGFTTPGNGDLGDQIKSSNGKDFYTIHTKNNNTFYMVIDHTNSTENVYMLSLIDEDDLAEFLKDADTKTSQKTTPPVILPEAQTQTSEGTAEKTQTQEETPAPKGPFQNSMIWIILLAGAGIVAFYYFKIYKPEHEEEEDDSEGIETGDGLPTEFEE